MSMVQGNEFGKLARRVNRERRAKVLLTAEITDEELEVLIEHHRAQAASAADSEEYDEAALRNARVIHLLKIQASKVGR